MILKDLKDFQDFLKRVFLPGILIILIIKVLIIKVEHRV